MADLNNSFSVFILLGMYNFVLSMKQEHQFAERNTQKQQVANATPWARATKNVKKPQSQMCESCRKAWFDIFVKNPEIF